MTGASPLSKALVGLALFVSMFVLTALSERPVIVPGVTGWLLMAVATVQAAREKGRSLWFAVLLALLVPVGWLVVAGLGTAREVNAEGRARVQQRAARFLRRALAAWLLLGGVAGLALVLFVLAPAHEFSTTQLRVFAVAALATLAIAVALFNGQRWGLYGWVGVVVLLAVGNALAGQAGLAQLPVLAGTLSLVALAWPGWAELH